MIQPVSPAGAGRPGVPQPRARPLRPAPRGSLRAAALAILAWLSFLAACLARSSGHLVYLDQRIVAHLIPLSDHHWLLSRVHPLVHTGDAVFVVPVSLLIAFALWTRGYRRSWILPVLALLSWAIELGCKALLPQPAELGPAHGSLRLDLLQGPQAATVLDWLRHAAPQDVAALVRHAGASLDFSSSFPSGTTARGAFVFGLLIWLCGRLPLSAFGALLVLVLLLPLATLGAAVVLFAWHWPSDVLGGYLLGLGLLTTALALLRRPYTGPTMARASGYPRS